MGKGLNRRKLVFDRYSDHLSHLIDNGDLGDLKLEDGKSYICPICTNQFSEADLNADSSNMLTLEDSPPDSLGGKKIALTCKACNSACGHDLDFHIQERMLELDAKEFLPNSTQKGKTTIDGVTVNSEVRVKDNKIEVVFTDKNNNPEKTKEYLKKVIPNEMVTVEPKPSRVDSEKFQIALLKSAYVLAFAKFGYNFILNPCFNIVRKQLKNPDKLIYPEGFWTYQPFKKEHEGVHFILDKGYESIFVIMPLTTKSTTRRFGVVLPLPGTDLNSVVAKLKEQEGGFGLTLDPMGGSDVDYLNNNEAIKKMNDWIGKINAPQQ